MHAQNVAMLHRNLPSLVAAAALAILTSGCLAAAAVGAAGAVVGAAGAVTGAVVGTTVSATGAVVDAAIPGDDDDDSNDKPKH